MIKAHRKVFQFICLTMLLFIVFVSYPLPVNAHALNSGFSNLKIQNKTVSYELVIPIASLLKFDLNKDNDLSLDELDKQKTTIYAYLYAHLQLQSDSNNLELSLDSMEKKDNAGIPAIQFNLQFTSKQPVEDLQVQYNLLFDDVDPTHVNFLTIANHDDMDQFLFDRDHRNYFYKSLNSSNSLFVTIQSFVGLGIRHILSGYDHLLFLLSLVIIARRLKDILSIVTSFTIAHSITLFLAATHIIAVSTRWVEAAIAVTICYVAVENWFAKTVKKRWLITFFFGLIHGLGFASVLIETGLPSKSLVTSLLSFNVGVEIGQLGLVLLALPLLFKVQKFDWYRKVVIGTSSIIFIIAFYWFLQRVGVPLKF